MRTGDSDDEPTHHNTNERKKKKKKPQQYCSNDTVIFIQAILATICVRELYIFVSLERATSARGTTIHGKRKSHVNVAKCWCLVRFVCMEGFEKFLHAKSTSGAIDKLTSAHHGCCVATSVWVERKTCSARKHFNVHSVHCNLCVDINTGPHGLLCLCNAIMYRNLYKTTPIRPVWP